MVVDNDDDDDDVDDDDDIYDMIFMIMCWFVGLSLPVTNNL